MMGEIDMRKVEIIVLSESEIKSILSTGIFPEKDATKNPQRMSPNPYYILKDESEHSFYVFKLKDHSPKYAWLQIAYVRIGDGESWKGNPDLAALLDVPKPDAASNTRRKTNADKTRQKIQLAWDKQEAERKIAAEQARQDALDKRIEDVKQQSGETFPKTPEEIKLVEDLIISAKYEDLLKLCEGKDLDFNVNATMGTSKVQVPLLSRAIEQSPQYRDQYFLERKNKIFEFVLNHGGAAAIPTERGAACVADAARTNNKTVFDLLVKNGFDFNQKIPNGKTVLEYLLEQNIKVDPEIMGRIQAGTRPSLFTLVREGNADELKKALEDEENRAAVNTPIEPTGGGVAGKTLLEYALSPKDGFPHTETVKTLLAAGAKFKEKNISGLMLSKQEHLLPLFWEYRDRMSGEDWDKCFNYAALYRNTDAFKFFLEKGLDPEKPENSVSTRTPRFNAYLQGTQEMVDMLEARGFKKPFWAAIMWNDLELVKEYLDAGADVNEADKVSRSKPIMHALSDSHLEMAELLLEHGVKVSPDDYRRAGEHYPVEIAAHGGQTKIMDLLLKHGFVPDFPKTPGDTKHPRQSSALYIALLHKHYETAKLLLKYGARTDVTDEKTVFDREQGKSVKIDAGLEELFKNDPEALKVLGAKKGFFDGF
ncbi:MAG: ankyrin repeat domain-containing protein [Lentisphaeria bacterium]|nr:ankyrin repeat domain-containing protein [Lentisphaeria bacterium]